MPHGDARPHALSRASASCPISSRCRPTASSGSSSATDQKPASRRRRCRARSTTLVWATAGEFAVEPDRERSLRARRAAAYPAGAPLVCRQGARPAAAKVDAVIPLEHGDDSAALVVVADVGERQAASPLFPAADGQLDALRPRSTATGQRHGGGAPRPARGHADRRRAPSRSSSRLLLARSHAGETIEPRRHSGSSAVRPRRSPHMPAPAVDEDHGANREQSNTTVIVDDNCVVKIFRKHQRGHSSRRSRSAAS